jgi:hypothetical protein
LNGAFKSKVQLRRLIGFSVAQNGSGFARIMITVMKEENYLTSDFTLQAARSLDFCQ